MLFLNFKKDSYKNTFSNFINLFIVEIKNKDIHKSILFVIEKIRIQFQIQ